VPAAAYRRRRVRVALPVVDVVADRYELGASLGRGGMAEVFEARDRVLQRPVAVKVFRGAADADRARFEAEAHVLASLNHPGLVQVYDAGEQDGDAFLVLELIDGPSLAARVGDTGRLPADEVAGIGAQIADALAFVHDHGVVHRDVTPSNILCAPDGRPRLADFGIARLVDTTRITAARTTIGTVAYMAPEQVQGQDVTPAADVYALGLVLLELLTGHRGFRGSPQEVAAARLVRRPDTNGVPEAWRRVLEPMTALAPRDRPSAPEVRDRLLGLRTVAEPTTALVVPPATVGATTAEVAAPTVVDDGTAVLPLELVPDRPPRARRWRLLAPVVAGLVVLAGALAAAHDGGGAPPATTTTVPSSPVTTVATTTTVRSQPAAPAPKGGHDKGPGKEEGTGKGHRGA
jgi:serine/threonine protein kinase